MSELAWAVVIAGVVLVAMIAALQEGPPEERP